MLQDFGTKEALFASKELISLQTSYFHSDIYMQIAYTKTEFLCFFFKIGREEEIHMEQQKLVKKVKDTNETGNTRNR